MFLQERRHVISYILLINYIVKLDHSANFTLHKTVKNRIQLYECGKIMQCWFLSAWLLQISTFEIHHLENRYLTMTQNGSFKCIGNLPYYFYRLRTWDHLHHCTKFYLCLNLLEMSLFLPNMLHFVMNSCIKKVIKNVLFSPPCISYNVNSDGLFPGIYQWKHKTYLYTNIQWTNFFCDWFEEIKLSHFFTNSNTTATFPEPF